MANAVLDPTQHSRLIALLHALIDQRAAKVLVEPYERSTGFWFGGGNMVRDRDGRFHVIGRYRNHGDSRTGLAAGSRGLELAVFTSGDGATFEKRLRWSKQDLSYAGGEVISIEGAALRMRDDGTCEVLVSSEKDLEYPAEYSDYRKPGTGVWTIDRFTGQSVDRLDSATIQPALDSRPEPGYLHVKDPVYLGLELNGVDAMLFCNHPFTWASANTGFATRREDNEPYSVRDWELIHRGPAWDVAGTRITARMPIPPLGVFADLPPCSVYFYDGLECYRQLEPNVRGLKRPRGYSCEEIGGACFGFDSDFPAMLRLSPNLPLFISPYGTGCSRYVDVCVTPDALFATWQQSQDDLSQPLVGHDLDMERVEALLRT